MNKVLVLALVLLAFIPEFYAKPRRGLVTRPLETTGSIILSTGVAYCSGDAWESPFSKSIIDGANYDLAIGYRQMFPKGIGFRVNFQRSSYAADDGDGKHHGVGLYRSATNLYALTARVEQEYIFGPKYRIYKRNSIYAFFGGGVMQGKVNYPAGAYVGFPDFRAGVITFGMGYTYNVNRKVFLGAEFTTQYALTDKVDGYPLRVKPGTQTFNDAMGNFDITLGFVLF